MGHLYPQTTDISPPGAVLVPRWTATDSEMLPHHQQEVTFVVENARRCRIPGERRRVVHGIYLSIRLNDGNVMRGFQGTHGARWWLSADPEQYDHVTHWSPRVGVPLPEAE